MAEKDKPGKAKKDAKKELAEKLKERSKQISEELGKKIAVEEVSGIPVKKLEEIEKEISEETLEQEVAEAVEPRKEKPKSQPSGAKVKSIEKVEKELSVKVEKEAVQKEAKEVYAFGDGIKKAREFAKKRKFIQTWDLAISMKGLNLKKPENRFSAEFVLPNGLGKPVKVGVIADTLAASAEKAGADLVVRKGELDALVKDKKKVKKIANEIDWFFGEISLMAQVGKTLGTVLGPRGKIPKPLPPNADVTAAIKRARSMVRVSLKENPVVHITVGSEDMDDKAVLKNLEEVYEFVKGKLAKGMNSIRSAHLKLTMGKPVRLQVK